MVVLDDGDDALGASGFEGGRRWIWSRRGERVRVGKLLTRTRRCVPATPREMLRNSHRGRPTSSAIRKTASRRFWDPKPHTPGRDLVWARGGYGLP